MKKYIFLIILLINFFIGFSQNQLTNEEINGVIQYASSELESNSDNIEYLKIRGAAYYLQKEYSKALIDFTNASKLVKDKDVFFNLGMCNTQLKEYSNSVIFYSKSIEIDNFYIEAYLLRGYSYLMNQQYVKAKNDFEFCLKQKGETFDICLNLGAINLMLKKYEIADVYLKKADAFEINNAYVYFYKAGLYGFKKDYINLCKYYQLSLDNSLPKDYDNKDIMNLINIHCK